MATEKEKRKKSLLLQRSKKKGKKGGGWGGGLGLIKGGGAISRSFPASNVRKRSFDKRSPATFGLGERRGDERVHQSIKKKEGKTRRRIIERVLPFSREKRGRGKITNAKCPSSCAGMKGRGKRGGSFWSVVVGIPCLDRINTGTEKEGRRKNLCAQAPPLSMPRPKGGRKRGAGSKEARPALLIARDVAKKKKKGLRHLTLLGRRRGKRGGEKDLLLK